MLLAALMMELPVSQIKTNNSGDYFSSHYMEQIAVLIGP